VTQPALATVEDLGRWPGVVIGNDQTSAEALLAAASALVRRHCRQTWLDDDGELEDDIPPAVGVVVVQVAARVWNNPTGVVHDVAGPFSARYAEWVAAGLVLTDTEKAMLPAPPTSGLWAQGTTRGDEDWTALICPPYGRPLDAELVEVVGGGDPVPWLATPDAY
jgi:hypothetical protein